MRGHLSLLVSGGFVVGLLAGCSSHSGKTNPDATVDVGSPKDTAGETAAEHPPSGDAASDAAVDAPPFGDAAAESRDAADDAGDAAADAGAADAGTDVLAPQDASSDAGTQAGACVVDGGGSCAPHATPIYIKASNTKGTEGFGGAVAISADGSTLAVGAPAERSSATGINGDQTSTAGPNSGAVYVFVRTGATWTQQAYIKASNAEIDDRFGGTVALSADGSTLAVGAQQEGSAATGINGDQSSNAAMFSGAVYVFSRTGTTWTQQAYIKASNTEAMDAFGTGLALSADGATLAVGAPFESSASRGINGDQTSSNLGIQSGAVYVFARAATTWSQQAYIKASNADPADNFGQPITLSADGSTLAVGAQGESSSATGVGGDQTSNATQASGAAYVFTRSGTTWSQQAYIKASNPDRLDFFGLGIALSADGATLAVGAKDESSSATGIGGDQTSNAAVNSGAVYVFSFAGTTWAQQAYVKASNTDAKDLFGNAVALSGDGSRLAVSAPGEDSAARGLDGDQTSNADSASGAVYVFARAGTDWSQVSYVKASNTDPGDVFGGGLAMTPDSATLVIGAGGESSAATGVGGDQTSNAAPQSGAVYVY
jgi:hypothetical protein